MKIPAYKVLEERIDGCMIADRFRLRRELKKRKERGRVAKAIEKSSRLVSTRLSSRPVVKYPEELPVSSNVEKILQTIINNQVVIIAGETGSGKTTQLPKICLEAGLGIFGTIGHTQPRRVAARSIAHWLAEELDSVLGQEVGYQVRFQEITQPTTLIKVMTDGVLLAETQGDRFLERYDTLIIDEAHERSLNIDFLLGYIKRILPKRPDLKVLITSATIDVDRFSNHFDGAPVIEVSGRTYPVKMHYRAFAENDEEDDPGSRMILEILEEIEAMPRGDVLIFLPGEREIRETARAIKRSLPDSYELLPLYSRLSIAEQNRIFSPRDERRIVLATNVAETSLTVPGIRYVIDPGLARISRYSLRSKVQQLPIEKISQASSNQRAGRCGRTSEGVCFRLYTEEEFSARPAYTEPEIIRTNLATVILRMLNLKLGDIQKFPFVQRPEQKQINDGYALLFELGAVDKNRHITRLGKQIALFPVDLRFSRMLVAAGKTGCLSEMLIIASGLSVQDPRERPFGYRQTADEMHQRYWDEKSDFIALINLWNTFEEQRQALSQSQLRSYCRENFLSFSRMREWREIHRQLLLISRESGFKMNKKSAAYAAIHRSVMVGLLGHIAQRTSENQYAGARNRSQFIFPGSSQFIKKPKWLVSAELTETTRLYARTVAEIESHWIEPLAGHLVRRSYHDPTFDVDKGQVIAREEVTLYGLVIVNNRIIDFGGVDQLSAREIFLQKGLVEGMMKTRLKFFSHNRRLIREIEILESKTRRRDILIENRMLFDFYDEVIPEGISSEFELAAFVDKSASNAARLRLKRDDLMRREAKLPARVYPDTLKVGESFLPLEYKFEPGGQEDGVSIDVPLVLLGQVPDAQLDWLVPGLLKEKCLALIRSLPKSIRKNFVPAQDYVDKALKNFQYDGRPVAEALADRLFRISGTQVSAKNFQPDGLDRHLRINVRVLGEKGKVLAVGRDLNFLIESLSGEISEAIQTREDHQIEVSGATDWAFGDVPEFVELDKGGVMVTLYPAIVDEGESVGLRLIETDFRARSLTEQGLLKLTLLRLSDQVRFLEQNIRGFDRFSLYFATRGLGSDLRKGIVRQAFRATFLTGESIRSESAFEAILVRRKDLSENTDQIAKLVSVSLEQALTLEASAKHLSYRDIADDILRQLDEMFPANFPESTALDSLRQYPRYLKGIKYRLEKLNPTKDRASMRKIIFWQERYMALGEEDRVRLRKFRWMLDEYRISLFSQPLGTTISVSDKRLIKEWESVMGLQQ